MPDSRVENIHAHANRVDGVQGKKSNELNPSTPIFSTFFIYVYQVSTVTD